MRPADFQMAFQEAAQPLVSIELRRHAAEVQQQNEQQDACSDEDGVTAIEYGLLAALIALALAGGATILGTGLNNIFNDIGTSVDNANVPVLP